MVSIVIPAYNEEKVIAETVNAVLQVFEQGDQPKPEIIVVDDGSTDRTTEVCRQLSVVTVTNPVNVGYGFSLKRGIAAASNDTIVIIDADGTYPVEHLLPLLELYNKGFDMVVGARQGTYYEQSFLKKALRYFLRVLVEYTTNNKIPDINSGMRIFSKKEVSAHLHHLSNAFSFTTSITLVYLLNHRFVTYMPIGYNKRVGNSKVKIVRDIFRTLQYIIEIILYFNPVKIYILFFFLIVAQGLISGALYLLTHNAFFDYVVFSDILALPIIIIAAMLAMQFKQYKPIDK